MQSSGMGIFDKLANAFSRDNEDEPVPGTKQWDGSQWAIDGVPVTYRVTWKTDGGEQHEREFTDVDQGYSFYQDMQKGATAYDVTWDHQPY